MRLLKWLVARWAVLAEATHDPGKAFTRNLDGPGYLPPLILLGSAFAGLSLLQVPWTIEWARSQMQAAGTPPEQAANAVRLIRQTQWLAFVSAPVLLFLRWLMFATLIWTGLQMSEKQIDFSRVLSVVAYSYTPFLLRDTISVVILYARGAAVLGQPDNSAGIGLNLFLPHMRPPWPALARHINIFELWFLVLLTTGIAKLGAMRWKKALAVTLAVWVFVFVFRAGLVWVTYSAQSSLGL